MFEADEVDEGSTELTIDALEWDDVPEALPEESRRVRRSSQFAVQVTVIGVRFEVFDPDGEQIGRGWRPTVQSAKHAAKRRIRRTTSRERRDRG